MSMSRRRFLKGVSALAVASAFGTVATVCAAAQAQETSTLSAENWPDSFTIERWSETAPFTLFTLVREKGVFTEYVNGIKVPPKTITCFSQVTPAMLNRLI